MRHLDLFSGVGGFSYAIDQVWNNVEHIFCDNNKFCCEVIKKNFGKESLIYGDVRTITRQQVITDTANYGCNRHDQKSGVEGKISENQKQSGDRWTGRFARCDSESANRSFRIDILTGGFPCQPFSHAGQRRGKKDDRYLWDEMFRVIKEFQPSWIVGENVAGIITMAQQQGETDVGNETDIEECNDECSNTGGILYEIIENLECVGYTVQIFVIPAVAVGAPHRRDRIWIVAQNANRNGNTIGEYEKQWDIGNERNSFAGNEVGVYNEKGNASNSERWESNWIKVATKLCGVDDGLPAGLDGFKLSKSNHRAERLKALGNSIVPQVVMEIFKTIKVVDTSIM